MHCANADHLSVKTDLMSLAVADMALYASMNDGVFTSKKGAMYDSESAKKDKNRKAAHWHASEPACHLKVCVWACFCMCMYECMCVNIQTYVCV